MKDYRKLVKEIPDYPKPGVLFRDLMPVFSDGEAFTRVVNEIWAEFIGLGVDKVMGAEARGFILGSALATRFGAGFVPARKEGKLPREVRRVEYSLEYGEAALEVLTDALVPGDRVLVVDDLLATGGTAVAMVRLIKEAGAEVVGLGFLMELEDLGGRLNLRRETEAYIKSLMVV